MADPTPAEIEAGGNAVVRWLDGMGVPSNLVSAVRPYAVAQEALRAVLPDHDARVAQAIARDIEATNHQPGAGCDAARDGPRATA